MYEKEYRFNRELSVRDLVKEKWALAKASAVVRVYQPDVYANSGFWQTKLKSGFRLASKVTIMFYNSILCYQKVDNVFKFVNAFGR